MGGGEKSEYEKVVALGGLYVIGTNRHESRRIDNQLRGRAGRQGDPGTSRFFISLEDDLMVRYKVNEMIYGTSKIEKQSKALDNPIVRREIARAQRIIEGQNFEIRKTLRQYSTLVEEQRKRIGALRQYTLVTAPEKCTFLELSTNSHYKSLGRTVEKRSLDEVIRQIALFHIDDRWAQHLAQIADIQEGIHLMRYAGRNPLNEFQKAIHEIFAALNQDIFHKIESSINELQKRRKRWMS